MKLSDFDYHLPKHLIAQHPKEPRDSSKLMVVGRKIEHRIFRDLIDYLSEGDVLVLNDSKVLPARLFGKKKTGGKAEVLLISKKKDNLWDCLIKGKNIRENTRIIFSENRLEGIVKSKSAKGKYKIEFLSNDKLEEVIREIGEMPTPPYIKEVLDDDKRYQTVYAKEDGSIAAPTAGFHFTAQLLDKIEKKGIDIVHITLHVSIGTFLPVKSDDIREHRMEPEHFEIDASSAQRINSAKSKGRKIFACGTTSAKALESACDPNGELKDIKGESDLFIYPGYEFRSGINALLTNFHLPKSTLLMLVSAFAKRDRIMRVYKEAIENSYRFYSFGDAMLILR